jgi:hypothetical protein
MTSLAVVLAAAAVARAGPDCADPFILARRVPECVAVQREVPIDELARAADEMRALEGEIAVLRAERRDEQGRRVARALPAAGLDFDGAASRSGEAVVDAQTSAVLQNLAEEAQYRSQVPARTTVPAPDGADWDFGTIRRAETAWHAAWLADLISTIGMLLKAAVS